MTTAQLRALATKLGLKYDESEKKEVLVTMVTEELARDIKSMRT